MAKIIKNKMNKVDLGVKRLYLRGVVIEEKCKCGNKLLWDGGESCLYYPAINKPEELYFLCDKCENEFQVMVMLKVSLELVK